MNKWIIFGGGTFIGASLARRLVTMGVEVHVVVQQHEDLWRFNNMILSVHSHVINMDDPEEIYTVLQAVKAPVIVNAVSYGENGAEIDFDQIYDRNFFSVVLLLQQAKEVGFTCFINTGTCQEYGRGNGPFSETSGIEPLTHFGIAKATSTLFCVKEAKRGLMPIYTVRPFIPYGPFQSRNSFVTQLFLSTMMDVTFKKYYGNAVYDFVYIDDLINVYLAIAKHMPENDFVFNGGSGVPVTLREVVKTFENVWQHDMIIDWNVYSDVGFSLESVGSCYAEMSRVKNVLDVVPEYDLLNGLTLSFEWFLKNQIVYEDPRLDSPEFYKGISL